MKRNKISQTIDAIHKYEKKSLEFKKNLEKLIIDDSNNKSLTNRKFKYIMINKFD
jgi:hypothetical protein